MYDKLVMGTREYEYDLLSHLKTAVTGGGHCWHWPINGRTFNGGAGLRCLVINW